MKQFFKKYCSVRRGLLIPQIYYVCTQMKANFASVEGNGKSPSPVQADQAFSIRLKSWKNQDSCIVAQVLKKIGFMCLMLV